ncbi:acylphosphatase-2 [Culicoides brevitarsis]|uniref:acylphosphatase-2 n=1 Tax=Culicoides brevitarsis TaxID=469753 RepID=UPI00307BF3FD
METETENVVTERVESPIMDEPDDVLVECDFEVFGHVQGVSFTKYCKDIALSNGIRGWVKNSKKGTIIGKMQGIKVEMDKMVHWLSKVGSPGCEIERCDFTNWETIYKYDYKDFQIRF